MLEFFYPPRCPSCGELNETGKVCEECAAKLDLCRPAGKVCLKCGLKDDVCECGKYNHLFDGICAPFLNDGQARQAVYAFKFGYRPFAAEYFGKEAARCFKARFGDVRPDLLCFVPTHRKKLKKRDYDYVALISKAISSELCIPILKDGLKAVKQNEAQHGLTIEKRRANVKGAYLANTDLTGKTVLLIDDIKTTGYTLSECAKQLKLAGAEKVFALTVLISPGGSCKPENIEL